MSYLHQQVCDLHDGFWVWRSHSVLTLPSHLPRGLHWPLADALFHLPLLHGAGRCSLAVHLRNQLSSPRWQLLPKSNHNFLLAKTVLAVQTGSQGDVALCRCVEGFLGCGQLFKTVPCGTRLRSDYLPLKVGQCAKLSEMKNMERRTRSNSK